MAEESFWNQITDTASRLTDKVRGYFGDDTPPSLPQPPYNTTATGNAEYSNGGYSAPTSTGGLPSVAMPSSTAPIAYTPHFEKPTTSFTKQFRGADEAPTIAVVGGGLAGMMAVDEALRQGKKVQWFNADGRTGGRVQSSMMGACKVNAGAEIIDNDDPTMLKLCQELGVPLIDRSEIQPGFDDSYHVGGKHLGEEALINPETGEGPYAALRAQIAADQAAMKDANGQWTEHGRGLDKMSADEYLRRHAHITPPHVDKILRAAFTSEIGRDLHEQSALNLVDFACTQKLGLGDGAEFRIYQSDEAYVVQGGTEAIIEALEARIKRTAAEREASGERNVLGYHPQTELKAVHADTANGMKHLEFFNKDSGARQDTMADGVVLAIPAYALAQVDGQENLGLKPADSKLIADTQYNQWLKVTFKTHGAPWQTDAQGNPTTHAGGGFTDGIYQSCWTDPANGTVTMLMGGTATLTNNPAALMSQIKTEYAASLGKPVDQIFDDSVAPCIRNWSKQNGCSVAPKPGTYADLHQFSHAQRDDPRVGFAGNWIMKGNKWGFMENTAHSGIEAAKQVSLACPTKSQAQGQAQGLNQNISSTTAPIYSDPASNAPQGGAPNEAGMQTGANVERYVSNRQQAGGHSTALL